MACITCPKDGASGKGKLQQQARGHLTQRVPILTELNSTVCAGWFRLMFDAKKPSTAKLLQLTRNRAEPTGLTHLQKAADHACLVYLRTSGFG